MLDKKSNAVLTLLHSKAANAYKVLNKNELLQELPQKLKIDMQSLLAVIAFLAENEYISVKYQDKEEICIATTVKTESYLDGEKDILQKAKISNLQIAVLFAGVFLAAFLGALIAGLIGKLF